MNTKGTRFLAILAVLAMAFAGFAVFADASQSDAAPAVAGPGISFTDAVETTGSGSVSNELMGNVIDSYYQASTNTYYLTGTLSMVDKEAEGGEQLVMYNVWKDRHFDNPVHDKRFYMITFNVTPVSGKTVWYEDIYDEKVETSVNYQGAAYKYNVSDEPFTLIYALKSTEGEIKLFFSDSDSTEEVSGVEYTIVYNFTLSKECLADGESTATKGIVNELGGILSFTGDYNSTVQTAKAGSYKNADGETIPYDGSSVHANNVGLGNNIQVSYDPLTKTYKVSGTLAYQNPVFTYATKKYTNVDNSSKLAFSVDNAWVDSTDGKTATTGNYHYGLVMSALGELSNNIYVYPSSGGDLTPLGVEQWMKCMTSSDLKVLKAYLG